MVTQYSHKLILAIAASSTQDSNGNWIAGSPSTQVEITCRAEPNGKGAFLKAADGTQIIFDWTVYMPLPVNDIAPGTPAEIKDASGVTIGKGIVARFSRGQLNARVWI